VKPIRWTVTGVLTRPGPILAFVQVETGEPEAGDRVRCVETGQEFTVVSMALGLGPEAMAAGRRGVELSAQDELPHLSVGMRLQST
jgi:hypothetical protein